MFVQEKVLLALLVLFIYFFVKPLSHSARQRLSHQHAVLLWARTISTRRNNMSLEAHSSRAMEPWIPFLDLGPPAFSRYAALERSGGHPRNAKPLWAAGPYASGNALDKNSDHRTQQGFEHPNPIRDSRSITGTARGLAPS